MFCYQEKGTRSGYGFVFFAQTWQGLASSIKAVRWFTKKTIEGVTLDAKFGEQFKRYLQRNRFLHENDPISVDKAPAANPTVLDKVEVPPNHEPPPLRNVLLYQGESGQRAPQNSSYTFIRSQQQHNVGEGMSNIRSRNYDSDANQNIMLRASSSQTFQRGVECNQRRVETVATNASRQQQRQEASMIQQLCPRDFKAPKAFSPQQQQLYNNNNEMVRPLYK